MVRLLAERSETYSNVKLDLGFERPTCLATLKSSDRGKQFVWWWLYIYILIHLSLGINLKKPKRMIYALPFHKKGDPGLAKNYRGITLTSVAAKIYNILLRNRIEPKIDNILRKNQNGFRRNRSTTSQILTIRRILEGVRAKKLQATLLFVDFTKAFDSIHRDGANPTSVRHT